MCEVGCELQKDVLGRDQNTPRLRGKTSWSCSRSCEGALGRGMGVGCVDEAHQSEILLGFS